MRRPRSKYGAQPTTVDGVRFASKAEAARWQELRLLERAGRIESLRRQVRYPLLAVGAHVGFRLRAAAAKMRGRKPQAGVLVGHYVADFEYFDPERPGLVTEDVKGFVTELSRWKMKHFEAQYGRPVIRIRRR